MNAPILWWIAIALVGWAIGFALAGHDVVAFWLIMGAAVFIALALSVEGRR